jgi:hypothetical protein
VLTLPLRFCAKAIIPTVGTDPVPPTEVAVDVCANSPAKLGDANRVATSMENTAAPTRAASKSFDLEIIMFSRLFEKVGLRVRTSRPQPIIEARRGKSPDCCERTTIFSGTRACGGSQESQISCWRGVPDRCKLEPRPRPPWRRHRRKCRNLLVCGPRACFGSARSSVQFADPCSTQMSPPGPKRRKSISAPISAVGE